MNIRRNIIMNLMEWKNSPHRKSLWLEGITSRENIFLYILCLIVIFLLSLPFFFHKYHISFSFSDENKETTAIDCPVRFYYTKPFSDKKSLLTQQNGCKSIVKFRTSFQTLKYFRIDIDHPTKYYYDLKEMQINNYVLTGTEIFKMIRSANYIRPELVDGNICRFYLTDKQSSEKGIKPRKDLDYYVSLRCSNPVRYLDYNSYSFYLKLLLFFICSFVTIILAVREKERLLFGMVIGYRFLSVLLQWLAPVLLLLIAFLFFYLRLSLYTNLSIVQGVTIFKSDSSIFYIFLVCFLLCAAIQKWYTVWISSTAIITVQFFYLIDCFSLKQFNTRFDMLSIFQWENSLHGNGKFFLYAVRQSYFIISVLIVLVSVCLAIYLVKCHVTKREKRFFMIFCIGSAVALAGIQFYPFAKDIEDCLYWNVFSFSLSQTMNKKYSKEYQKNVKPFKLKYTVKNGLGLKKNLILLTVEGLSSYQSKLFSKLPFDYLPKFDKIVKNEAAAYSDNYLSSSFNTATTTFSLWTGFSPTLPDYYAIFRNRKFYQNPLPQLFKKAGYKTIYMTSCATLDGIDLLLAEAKWDKVVKDTDPIFNNHPRYVYNSVSDDVLLNAVIDQVKSFDKKDKRNTRFFIHTQTLGIHGPFFDYRTQKYSYIETVKTFDLLFTDFVKKLHAVDFFKRGGLLVVTGDHRVMRDISHQEQKALGFFTPQSVPFAVFGNLPCKLDSKHLYSHVDLHYSLQWLMLDKVKQHQYQRNMFISDSEDDDENKFFCTFYQLRSNPSVLLFNTRDKYGKIYLSGDDTKITGQNLLSEERKKIGSLLLWTREHMCDGK